jgi:MFS family permease
MLREPVVRGIMIAGFFSIGTVIGLSIFVPLYVEMVLGLSASASGVALIGFMGGATLGSMMAGRLISRMAHYKCVPVYAAPLAVAALLLLAVWPFGWSLAAVTALMTLAGVGMGPMYPATTVIIQNAVQPHEFGIATGTLNFFRLLGGAIIVAVFAAIVLAGLDVSIPGRNLDKFANARASADELAQQFRLVFASAAIFLGLACVAVAVIEERPLRGPQVRPSGPQ